MTYGAPAAISRRPCPEHVPDWELVPKEPAQQGFASRPAPVSQAELAASDRALNEKKAAVDFYDLRDRFALEQQNGRRS